MPDFNIRKASSRFVLVRKTANLTQEKLAERLGINPQTIKNYEKAGSENACSSENDPRINAIAGMKIETLYKMAQLCNVSADYLLGLSDIETPDINIKETVKLTGLSQKSVEKLAEFTSNKIGNTRLALLSCLIEDPRFLCGLLDEMLKYCTSYQQYAEALKKYKEEADELKKLSGGDELKELNMIMTGEYTPSVTDKQLAHLSDLKDVHYLKSQRTLDNVLDCLVYHYPKKCGLNPGNK